MEAREAYLRGVLSEMDREIYRRTLERVQVITRAMQPAEKEAYLDSNAFRNALKQTRKKDRVYRAMASGNAWPEDYEADFALLRPLIEQELRDGRSVDLAFLRSVRRLRQPLKTARLARRLAEEGRAESWVRKSAGRLAGELDPAVNRFLLSKEVIQLKKAEHAPSATEALLGGAFAHGLPPEAADRAAEEGSLMSFLRSRLFARYPALRSCGALRLDDGSTVSGRVREQLEAGRGELLRCLSSHFPRRRIRRLLYQNNTLRALQKQRERSRASAKNLQAALLRAVPEEVRDLYPLARAMHRKFVLHLGPTNSGKTWESIQRLHGARHGIYLGPLRLLAFEQFETLNVEDVPCSLVTGEEQIRVEGARVQSSTIEMADLREHYDVAVIDECQMIADRDRGGAWSAAVLGLCAEEIHVCASPDAERLLLTIMEDCGDEVEVVRHQRMAPLVVEDEGFSFPGSVRRGDALIVFSRARVHALAAELKQKGFQVSLIYGALPPDVRRNQAERFRSGETEVVVSTDAIAMGMNLPIARVVFMESEKYDGDITRRLTDSEIRQIAGRAGRYGQYDVGYVNAFGFRQLVAGALERPMLPLTHAMLRFPESLLGLPLTLTETLNRWIGMKDRSCFTKASTVRMVSLASRMETRSTDKRLLYDFLCIPFDETDPALLEDWKTMYHAEATGTHFDVMAVLPPFRDPETCTVAMLDRLEEDYRTCDLYYNYARRFLENPERMLTDIQQRKDLISSGIIHVLTTQKLTGRACRQCGHRLPWDWPFTICDHCYHAAPASRPFRPGRRKSR